MEAIEINYKAHIPAGVATASLVTLLMGQPAIVPLLIGGAIGGALPDIDIKGSAVEKLGSKAGKGASKLTRRLGGPGRLLSKITGPLGLAFDTIILRPICGIWRWLSENVFGKVYRKIFEIGPFGSSQKTLGEHLHWLDEAKPWEHRGGITHSFSFMFTSCIITVPLALLFQSIPLFVGCELGIISHLIADSMCVSGTKFFFPWAPPIGFKNKNGDARGRDVRIFPKKLQVSTGKDRITNEEIDNEPDFDKAMEMRKLRFREKFWQKFFQVAMVVLIIVQILGIHGFSNGGITMDFANAATPTVQTQQVETKQASNDTNTQAVNDSAANNATAANVNSTSNNTSNKTTNNSTSSASNNTAAAVAGGQTVNTASGTRVTENEGPTSFTYGDLDVSELPKGIMKLPDESLWVVGVGEVNATNLNNPKWTFTDEEKRKLLAVAQAQRTGTTEDAANAVSNAANDAANAASSTANSASSGIWSAIGDLLGIDIDGGTYTGGFIGLTPWTGN